jgi:glycosyltransferase involved in cell wall biosynthesis
MTGKRDTENYQKVQSILSKEIAEGRVVLEPQTDHVSEVISACDLMVSTSTYEGLPGAIIESLSGGVPVVASAIMPSKEVAQQNEHVTIVDGWDARHWAKVIDGKLNELLLTPKLQSVRAVRKSIAEGPFHFEISDRLMLQLYSAHRADGFRAYEQLPEQTFA